MKYIGDISKQDAQVLANLASKSASILEFGCGASSQVIAQYKPASADFFSLETVPAWIERTKDNFKKLDIPNSACTFLPYDNWRTILANKTFDFIFVDGVDSERLRFAMDSWPLLRVDGWMAFHDTRRYHDFKNLLNIVSDNFLEVNRIECNTGHSNISMIQKKVSEPYVDWNKVEGRVAWMSGAAIPPDNCKDLL